MNIADLVNPHIRDLAPYSSARDEYTGQARIFLDANENALGTPGGAVNYTRYPDPYQWELKKKISGIKGMSPEYIFLGNGSDEPIDHIIRCFCQPGRDSILIFPPTYAMYRVSAEVNNVQVQECSLTPDFQLDLTAYDKGDYQNAKVTFICSPNNPTGNIMLREDIEYVLDKAKGIVVLDEAYIDFCEDSTFLTKIDQYPHLVVMQTFSKAWGMAGLRLGMAFAHPEIIHYLNKVKAPYNISELTQRTVGAILDHSDQKVKMVEEILQLREELIQSLENIPSVQKIYPTDTNFVLVKFDDANRVYRKLIDDQIIVRNRSNVRLCEGGLRITVGSKTENEELIKALKSYG